MVVEYDWILGLGIMFAFAFIFNALSFDNPISFFAYLTIFNGFVVYADLLPFWTLILNIIFLSLVIYYSTQVRRF